MPPKRARAEAVFSPARFVGRRGELDRLSALLARGERLISLVGIGGVGKTRVAKELLARGTPFDAHFVDAAEATSLADLAAAIASTLGRCLPTGRQRTTVDAVTALLRGEQPLLLVLDNVEQLVVPAADAISAWVSSVPALRILTTSRERLRIDGEVVLEVGPLPVEGIGGAPTDAVSLLRDRVERALGGACPIADDVLAPIAHQLDGLPLALELVAPRIAALGTDAVLQRLTAPLDLLTRGARGRTRHESLRAVFAGSWELLSRDERRALAECSVFAGGFDLEAAEAVLTKEGRADAPRLVDVLAALVEKSLLQVRPIEAGTLTRLRYHMLPTLREYARERLRETGDPLEAERKHAAYYGGRTDEEPAVAPSAREATSRDWVSIQRENLAAVIARGSVPPTAIRAEDVARAALLLDVELRRVGPVERRVALLGRATAAIDHPPTGGPRPASAEVSRWRARLGISLGQAHLDHGSLPEACASLRGAASHAERAGARAVEGSALVELGDALLRTSHANAAEAFRRALDVAREAGSLVEEARALHGLGTALGGMGRVEEWREIVSSLEKRRELLGTERDRALVLDVRAELACCDGSYEEARSLLASAQALFTASADAARASLHEFMYGYTFHAEGRLEEARTSYESYLGTVRGSGYREFESWADGFTALLDWEEGRHPEARAGFERVLAGGLGSRYEGWMALVLACLEAEEGRADEARELVAAVDAGWSACGAISVAVTRTLVHALLEIAEATRTAAADAASRVAAAHATIEAALARTEAGVDPRAAVWVRMVVRATERALLRMGWPVLGAESLLRAEELGAQGWLVVEGRGAWFVPPGGARVTLPERSPLCALLALLALRRASADGAVVSRDELLATGWPAERVLEQPARVRVRVAVATLRKLGLRDLLETHGGGYRLRPDTRVALV